MTAFHLAVAFLLDAIIGDPPRLPHPVCAIGRMIVALERVTRRCLPRYERTAGVLTVVVTLAATALVVGASCILARRMHPLAGAIVSTAWLAMGFATRSLRDHGRRVADDLARGDIAAARTSVGRMVGRDTDRLDAGGISRAAVESIAESTVDGVLSPLFFAVVGGPVGLWVFKAASTCDSMIGHKDERYIRFGTFGARLDDVLNYIPARLALFLFPAAAWLANADPRSAWRVARRDHHRHASPNAGIPEAAAAGALNIRLGGPVTYDGVRSDNPVFGGEFRAPEPSDIERSIRILGICSLLALAAGILLLGVADFIWLSRGARP